MFVWVSNIKILEYDRIYISEGIDVNKTNASKNVKFVITGNLKILVVMVYYKKLLVLIILILFMLKEMLTALTFGI